MTAAPTTPDPQTALAGAVADYTRTGWRVESAIGDTAILVKGKATSHVLHLLLTVFTLGLWLPVWGMVDTFGGQRRLQVSVDGSGQVSASALSGRWSPWWRR